MGPAPVVLQFDHLAFNDQQQQQQSKSNETGGKLMVLIEDDAEKMILDHEKKRLVFDWAYTIILTQKQKLIE